MSKSNTNSDFLSQIQEAEAVAAEATEKAQQKATNDLMVFNKKEAEKTQVALDEARIEAKAKLKDRQEVGKKRYESLVADGKKEAEQFRKNTEPKIEQTLPQALTQFTNVIIG